MTGPRPLALGPRPSALDPAGGRRGAGSSAGMLFIGLLAIYACFHHSRDWNSASRLLLTFALVQHGSVEITPFVTSGGRLKEHPHTWDLASADLVRFYSDKAPGHSLLGVVPYWVAERLGLVTPHPAGADAAPLWAVDYWITLCTSSVATAGTATVLFVFLARVGVGPMPAMATALSYGLATIALPYATLYYGHVSAGLFCLISLALVHRRPGSMLFSFLGGVFAGCAVATEYPLVVFPAAMVLALALAAMFGAGRRYSLRGCIGFLAGGVPVAGLLAYYHFLVTGSPFRFPYELEVRPEFAYHQAAFGIPIGRPDLRVVGELLVGSRRGVLWFSPVLLGAIPGLWLLVRRGGAVLAAVCLATFAGLVWIAAGFPNWHGGLAAGPRFLLPSFPLLMVPVGVWLGTCSPGSWLASVAKIAWSVVAGLSGLLLVGTNVAGARIHHDFTRPITQFVWPMVRDGRGDPHLGQWVLDYLGVAPRTGLPALAITASFVAAVSLALLWMAAAREGVPRGRNAES